MGCKSEGSWMQGRRRRGAGEGEGKQRGKEGNRGRYLNLSVRTTTAGVLKDLALLYEELHDVIIK